MARKRKKGHREPNGRLSRKKAHVRQRETEAEREARSVALDARMRMFGLTREQAASANAATVIGRLLESRQISRDQHIAAQYYLADREAYLRAILAPTESRPPREGLSDGDVSYEKFVARAKARYEAAQGVVAAACIEQRTRLPIIAAENILIRDIDMPRLYGDLRVVLNHLVRHYLIGKRRAA